MLGVVPAVGGALSLVRPPDGPQGPGGSGDEPEDPDRDAVNTLVRMLIALPLWALLVTLAWWGLSALAG